MTNANDTLAPPSNWEITVRPWRSPRTGIESADEFTIRAIHRGRGWVQQIDRQTQADVERFDPEVAWARGMEKVA